jgi:DNA-binding NarL/FixJ family response regulator
MSSAVDGRSADRERGPAVADISRATRVLVVDDHPAVRWGLVQLLEDQPDLEVAAVATTAEVAVGQAESEQVDVAVVDYQLGGRNGLWVTRKLRALPTPPRVVIFSAFANDHLAANCVIAGAHALLSKSSLGEELCSTIRAVARGRVLFPRVPQTMVQLLRGRLGGEEEITFGMLLAGIPETEIRRVLALSEEELSQRRARMLAKLEALPGEVPGHENAERVGRAPRWNPGVERC